MLGKLAVALSLIASPVFAQDAPPADGGQGAAAEAPPPVAYKTKRVCRSVEVVGSSIPRTTCTTKKIPIKPVKEDVDSGSAAETAPQSDSQQ